MAGDRIATAILALTTDASQLFAGLDEAAAKASGGPLGKSLASLGEGLTSFGGRVSAAGGALTGFVTGPIAGAAAGLIALATTSAETGDRIAEEAQQAGLSAQAYQQLQFALTQVANVSETDVTRAFGNITKTIGQAAEGSKSATDALAALGYSAAEIASGTISTEDAFNRMNTAIQGSVGPAQAASIAGGLMGDKLGVKFAGELLASGSQVDTLRQQFVDLGLGMSDQALASAGELADGITTVKKQFADVGREIGVAFLPLLTDTLIPFIRDQAIPALAGVAQVVGSVIQWFSNLPGPVQTVIGVVGGLLVALGPVLLVVGQLAVAIGGLLPILAPVGATLAAIATGPIALIAAAIAGLVIVWVKWGDDIKRIVSETMTAVKTWLVDWYQSSILSSVVNLVASIGEFWFALQQRLATILMQIAGAITTWILDKLRPVIDAVKPILDFLGSTWSTNKDKIVGIAQALYEGVKGWIVDKFQAVVDGVKAKIDAVAGFFRDLKDKVVGHSYVPEMMDGIASQTGRLQSIFADPIKRVTDQVGGLFEGLNSKVTGWAQGLFGTSGGGGILSGLISGGMSTLTSLFTGGLNSLINMGVGLIGKGLSAVGGWIKGLFGGVSEAEKEARQSVAGFEQQLASTLTATQAAEAGNESWKKTVIAVRDAYAAVGLSEEEALRDVKALWDSSREGPEATARVIDTITEKMNRDVPDAAGTATESVEDFGEVTEEASSSAGDSLTEDVQQPLEDVAQQVRAENVAAMEELQRKIEDAAKNGNTALKTDLEKAMQDLQVKIQADEQEFANLATKAEGASSDAAGNVRADLVEAVADVAGKLGGAKTGFDGLGDKAETEAWRAGEAVRTDLITAVDDVQAGLTETDWETWAERGKKAVKDVKAEVDKLNFGSSPGGLKEIPLMLARAVEGLRTFRVAADANLFTLPAYARGGPSAPGVGGFGAIGGGGASSMTFGPGSIQIVQQPGEDGARLARRLVDEMTRLLRVEGTRRANFVNALGV